jgi:hypothetical protein
MRGFHVMLDSCEEWFKISVWVAVIYCPTAPAKLLHCDNRAGKGIPSVDPRAVPAK